MPQFTSRTCVGHYYPDIYSLIDAVKWVPKVHSRGGAEPGFSPSYFSLPQEVEATCLFPSTWPHHQPFLGSHQKPLTGPFESSPASAGRSPQSSQQDPSKTYGHRIFFLLKTLRRVPSTLRIEPNPLHITLEAALQDLPTDPETLLSTGRCS